MQCAQFGKRKSVFNELKWPKTFYVEFVSEYLLYDELYSVMKMQREYVWGQRIWNKYREYV